MDPRLEAFNSKEALRFIHVALLCTQGSPHQRPPMSRVVAMLTGDADVTKVVTMPSYITEWQLSGENSSYSGSITNEFSKQGDVDPLTHSKMITGGNH